MTTNPKVFLSYASEDRKKVSEIYQFLSANGCDPWMDVEKLLPGQDWEHEIEIAIENADFLIACLSPNSVDKVGYVQKELKKGLDVFQRFPEGKIFLIPVRLSECEVPRSLSKQQWLDWFNHEARNTLLEAIRISFAPRHPVDNNSGDQEQMRNRVRFKRLDLLRDQPTLPLSESTDKPESK